MHIAQCIFRQFKRFTDLSIVDLPSTTRLVVLVGPNGAGKSSVFDGFKLFSWTHGAPGSGHDERYHVKQGSTLTDWGRLVQLQFHEPIPNDDAGRKKLFYVRSAYRNEPEFMLSELRRAQPLLDDSRIRRLIENDASVSQNYQRLVASTVAGIYDGRNDAMSVASLRDQLIGDVRASMGRVFPDLVLAGTGNPLHQGTFYFDKGASRQFEYKNLSGGEKAVFDLLLDFVIKRVEFNNTVFCIDEPEAHMHTRLQGVLLKELFGLIPTNCQLWINTHSIGMMSKARELQQAHPDQVVFLDFSRGDFDSATVLRPAIVDRPFWKRVLAVALDNVADLVAPAQVVLCEGPPPGAPGRAGKAEFDAACYRTIFATEYADTDFLAVGNNLDVESDRLAAGRAIQTIVSGTRIVRVIDRDERTPAEVTALTQEGVKVLSRRHLEAFLLDDEILTKLCCDTGQAQQASAVIAAKQQEITASVSRGNASDDIKSASGTLYVAIRRLLGLTQSGSDAHAFMRDVLAPLVTPDTAAYQALRRDIFGA